MRLAAHPRLYVTPAQIARLKADRSKDPALVHARNRVAAIADEALKTTDFEYTRDTHNEHLIRARINQTRVVTLLVRWFQTGDRRYRDAAVAHIVAMGKWEYWSWITWRQKNADPLAIYDLSYGENSTTLAIAYDWLYDDLTDRERAHFRDIALARPFPSFLKHTASTEPNKHAWWFGKTSSNWNTVCAGGAGMLALAMHGEAPDCDEILSRVEWSFKPYMLELDKTSGAWPEGIGYWNYGMRYAFMYLLSHENATGRKHPLLRRPATKATLRFPVDLSPNGVPCSFGDVNHFAPLPFHFETARRLGAKDVLAMLAPRLPTAGERKENWPDSAETLLLHPRNISRAATSGKPVNRFYRGQDWAVLADRSPSPKIYLSARGGTTKVPHGHLDLLSFHCVVGDESMFTSLTPGEYLDTTFSGRRWDIFEMNPSSKNTLLVNGVGIAVDSSVTTTPIKPRGGKAIGYAMDATSAMGSMRDGNACTFCGRAFLMLNAKAFLIVDRIELPHVGRVEARFHTRADVKAGEAFATLAGQRQSMTAAFGCDRDAALWTAQGAPTTPGVGATMLRWCSRKQELAFTLATLLVPGKLAKTAVGVTVETRGDRVIVSPRGAGLPRTLELTTRLAAR